MKGAESSMDNCLIIDDKALVVFSLNNIFKVVSEFDRARKEDIWARLIRSFGYDKSTDLNLIYVDHPLRDYIGLSIKVKNKEDIEKKIKRYSEGLAYLLVYYFPEAEIEVLTRDECKNVPGNLLNNGIVVDLGLPHGCPTLMGEGIYMRTVFTRIIDHSLILDKLFELYPKGFEESYDSLETRVGMKPKCDQRILEVLQHPCLTYDFINHPTVEKRDEAIKKSQGNLIRAIEGHIEEYVRFMGVPDIYVEKIRLAKSTSEMFDVQDLFLANPEATACFIANFKL